MQAADHRRRTESGFSLLELVVVVAILTIVTGAAFGLMTSSQESFDRNELMAEAHENADFAVLRVTELLRGAGANPNGISSINSLSFVSNKEANSNSNSNRVVRVLSDLNCDGATNARVSSSGSNYYILSSEDVTLKFYPDDTTVSGVAVPGHTLCMIDNTAGTNPAQGVPVVLASNIIDFSCQVPADPRVLTVTITAGPTKSVLTSDPRYVTFTRVAQIRLRNRN
jgi:prepilin-type N-terminal cleavage/methylation domain-containing protein